MKKPSKLRLWIVVVALALVGLACNFPGYGGATTPPATPTSTPGDLAVTAVVGDDETATVTPAPGTPSPDVTPSPTDEEACTLRAAFVEDVTIPDDTEVEPGEGFVKTWRIQNSGTCPWESGTKLVPVAGDDLGGPASLSVPATEPEGEIELSVPLEAPEAPGTYKSNWQLQTPEGQNFGGVFYAQIVVPGEEPTPTPTTAPADDGEPSPPEELLAKVDPACEEVVLTWIDGQGEAGYRLEAPDLDVDLDADTTSYTWEDPPEGVSVVTLVAVDGDDEEIGEVETTVSVACGKQRPDLVVGSLAFDPAPPVAHLPVTVTVTVSNTGELDSGGFVVRWRKIKTDSGATCRWTVPEGLAAGETLELACTTAAYTSAYAELVTVATADATDLMLENDEENNTLERTIAVESPDVVYDFVENADGASWTSGPPSSPVPWSGDPEDDEGYVRLTSDNLETGGAIQGFCLETRPRPVADGWIRGEFSNMGEPGYTVEPGDRLRVTVAMVEDDAQGAVNYRVRIVPAAAAADWIIDARHTYGEGVEVLDFDLSPYAGQEAGLILQVEAGESPAGDRACWLEAVIYRYP